MVSAIVIGVRQPVPPGRRRRAGGGGQTRRRGLAGVTLAECDGEPTRLLDLLGRR
jgi:hypothetical protein